MKLLATVLTLFSLSAQAGEWKASRPVKHWATNTTQIAALSKKFPHILKETKYQLAYVTMLDVTVTNYQYVGDTLCSAADPRLKQKTVNYNICSQKGNAVKCANRSDMGPMFDPCQFDE